MPEYQEKNGVSYPSSKNILLTSVGGSSSFPEMAPNTATTEKFKTERPTVLQQAILLLTLDLKLNLRKPIYLLITLIIPCFLLLINNGGFNAVTPKTLGWFDYCLGGLYYSICLLFHFLVFLVIIVSELNSEHRRALFLNGMRKSAFWLRFSLKVLVPLFILSFLYTGFMRATKLFVASNYFIVQVGLILAVFQTVPIITALAIISQRHLHSFFLVIIFALIPFCAYIPYYYFEGQNNAYVVGILMSFFGPSASVTFQFAQFAYYDNGNTYNPDTTVISRGGVQFFNLWSSGIGPCWLIQILSCIVISCFVIFVMLKDKVESRNFINSDESLVVQEDESKFEKLPENMKSAISVRGLTKNFNSFLAPITRKSGFTAVNQIDMTIMHNEVYGFLGHNGAGKTTTISMLCGEEPITDGSITYHFEDGDLQMGTGMDDVIKSRIGVCTQQDLLYEELSCREILEFFAKMKGNVPKSTKEQSTSLAISNHVQTIIDAIAFTSQNDENKMVKEYSGGMKRKTTLAMSMLGDPEILFLDEPTAGMDPFNRRKIWDMIITMKNNRSVVLTTHFMDEADILSDRIGIINHGKMVTCGSSLYLKYHFGASFYLKFTEKNPSFSSLPKDEQGMLVVEACKNASLVSEMILSMIPDAIVESTENGETEDEDDENQSSNLLRFVWKIPYGNEKCFSDLMPGLEEAGCQSISLENTTLDQVFLKTGTEKSEEKDENDNDDDEVNGCTAFCRRKKKKGEICVEGENDSTVDMTPELLKQFWSGQQLKRTGSNVTKALALQKLTLLMWKWIPGIIVFVVMPVAYFIIGSALFKIGKPIGLSLDLWAWVYLIMWGMAAGMISSIFMDFGKIYEAEFFSVMRTLGQSKRKTVFWFIAARYLLIFCSQYILNVIISLIFSIPFTNTFAGWLVFTMVYIMYCYSWGAVVATIAFYVRTKKIAPIINGLFGFVTGQFFTVFVVLGFASSVVIMRYAAYGISIVPLAATQVALYNILSDGVNYNETNTEKVKVYPSFEVMFTWDSMILYPMICMLVIGTLVWVNLVLILRRETASRKGATGKESPYDKEKIMDGNGNGIGRQSAIGVEEMKLLASETNFHGLQVSNLQKSFQLKNGGYKHAVKGIDIAVKPGKIFTLLGPNGAGKTQCMKMLTRNIGTDAGVMSMRDANRDLEDYSLFLRSGRCGYVPQVNSLWSKATVQQHFNFAAELKGIDPKDPDCIAHVQAISTILGLHNHLDKKSKELSGGYKRKLCFAMAIIGTPELLYLDEMTTGMDSGARHDIWEALRPKINFSEGEVNIPAVVLSTHYLDEAEYLAHHVGIMVDGEMVAAGTIAELTAKFSVFITLQVNFTVKGKVSQMAKDRFLAELPVGSIVSESVLNKMTIKIPRTEQSVPVQIGETYHLLEKLKENRTHDIEFYSVAKMSLEQIFIEFCDYQFSVNDGEK